MKMTVGIFTEDPFEIIELCYKMRFYSERVERNPLIAFVPLRVLYSCFCMIKFKPKMDATPSFGVSMDIKCGVLILS